jgi:hypothetical protein
MRRDDWKLGGGIIAGSNAFVEINGKKEECHVLKIKGSCQVGETGNVFVEVNGQKIWILGSKLYTKELNENDSDI